MTNQKTDTGGAIAGALLIAAVLVCGAIGFGLGVMVHLRAVLTIVGGSAGLVLGFSLVYRRFKNL